MKFVVPVVIFLTLLACEGPNKFKSSSQNAADMEGWRNNKLELNLSHFDVSLTWLVRPRVGGSKSSSLLVKVLDSTSNLVDLPEGVSLEFYAWMPSMGHPLTDAGSFERLSTGVYLNNGIVFNMGGEWEMQLMLWGKSDEVIHDLKWYERW